MHRGIHILTFHHARCNALDRAETRGRNGTFAVDRLAQRVDHTSDHGVPYRHRRDASQALHRHAFGNPFVIAHDDHTNVVLFKVERNADHTIGKLHKLLRTNFRETFHAGNSIARFNDYAYIADVELGLEPFNLFLQITGDLLDQV